MARAKTVYSCTECGATSSKWQGQCPGCGVWNTLVETVAEPAASGSKRFAAIAGTSVLQTLSEIEAREEDRLPTGIGEFDRALGPPQLQRQLVEQRIHPHINEIRRAHPGPGTGPGS